MALNGQSFLEDLQASDHHRKRRFLFLGSGIAMMAVVMVWLGVSALFLKPADKKLVSVEADFSLWQTMRGGSMLLAQTTADRFRSIGQVFGQEKSYVVTPASAETK